MLYTKKRLGYVLYLSKKACLFKITTDLYNLQSVINSLFSLNACTYARCLPNILNYHKSKSNYNIINIITLGTDSCALVCQTTTVILCEFLFYFVYMFLIFIFLTYVKYKSSPYNNKITFNQC